MLAVLLALAVACGGSATDDRPPPPASPIASSPLPVPSASPADRITFYSADAGDSAGAVAAGDFNGDTVPDIVLAAASADGPANTRPDAGEAYIFLGPFTPEENRDPAAGDHDLVIYGARAGDQLGHALAVGDFSGDGLDDIALGAPVADGPDSDRTDSGQVYLLFGSSRLGNGIREVDLAEGDYDATVFGADADDLTAFVLHAADVNGDGTQDLIIGAFQADGPGNNRPNAGEVYLIYGGGDRRRFDLALDQNDAIVYGAEEEDRLGEAVGAGDIDGDGRDDLVLAATFASGPGNNRDRAGETYVIMGPPAEVIDTARGDQDVTILGIDPGDQIGHSIASGDTDGDGFADILLGAVSADGPQNGADLAGEAYLVDGAEDLPEVIDTAAGGVAALIYGASAKDRLGRSAAMGDVNGDGLSDLLISAPDVDTRDGDKPRAGAVYVFYGRPVGPYASTTVEADITLEGLDAQDIFGHEAFGMPPVVTADMNMDGLADILAAAPTADGPGNKREDAGEAYIIYMKKG
jgi:hypothetical protein